MLNGLGGTVVLALSNDQILDPAADDEMALGIDVSWIFGSEEAHFVECVAVVLKIPKRVTSLVRDDLS